MRTFIRKSLGFVALFAYALGVHAADTTITALPAASALAGTEPLPVDQSGETRKSTPAALSTYVKSTGAALTKTDDTNVTLTLGGSASTSLLNAANVTAGWTGQLGVARGGTGAATLANDSLLMGNGTSAMSAKAIPNCGSSTQALAYNTSTDTWSCQTVTGSGGTPGGSDTQVQYNNAGAFGGDAGFLYNATTNGVTLGEVGANPTLQAVDRATSGTGVGFTIRAGAANTSGTGGAMLVQGGTSVGTGGGSITIQGGDAGSVSGGGLAKLQGGNGGATSGNGGNAQVLGGQPVDGNGGAALLTGGPGTGTNRNGGNASASAGSGTGSGAGGDALITAGSAGSTGAGGLARLTGGGSTVGTPGDATVQGGIAATTGPGGNVNLTARNGAGTDQNGGNVVITLGTATGSGTVGAIQVVNGTATGAQTATFSATNKPGSATGAPTLWLRIVVSGTTYWIPLFAN